MRKVKLTKSQQKQIEKQLKKVKPLYIVVAFVFVIICVAGGYFVTAQPSTQKTVVENEISFHFLTLGNKYAGDCYYIQCGNVDILVDGGSRTDSVDTIYNYVHNQMTDNVIEYAIVTHADRDHIACFGGDNSHQSLFEKFSITTLIDFPRTNSTSNIYSNYQTKRATAISNGMTHYTAKQCYEETDGAKASYEIGENTTLNILYNKYYFESASDENEYSVVFQIVQGEKKFLFTGDLEKNGEKALVEHYGSQLTQVELFKAGHHGSKTSNTTQLFNYIQPKICVVSCVAGSTEYTTADANTFPTQTFVNNIAPYTTQVYVTSQINESTNERMDMNGNIVVTSNPNGVSVNCSNNNTVLKDTTWFQNHRTWPA